MVHPFEGSPVRRDDDVAGADESAFRSAPVNAPEHLDAGEDDLRLPWLEGDDEDEDLGGSGIGQGVILLGLGLLAICLIVGAVIWATRQRSDVELVADGGVIKAPSAPYKVRPTDPGGEVVAGTGDSSFAVAEGQTRPARIAAMDTPTPGFETPVATPSAPSSAAPKAASSTAPSSTPAADSAVKGVGVQVGAYSNRTSAEAGWATLKRRYDALSGYDHRIVEGQADIGTVYRLQAVTATMAAARSLCQGLQQADIACQVKN